MEIMFEMKEYARQMRENAVKDENGIVRVSIELWEQIADIVERSIVPPCKVGDKLYCVYSPPYPTNPADKGKWYMNKFEVARLHYGVKGLSIEMYGYGTVNVNEIGKNVFLTKDEAEKALKEREGNG